jgi:hypothetical protein
MLRKHKRDVVEEGSKREHESDQPDDQCGVNRQVTLDSFPTSSLALLSTSSSPTPSPIKVRPLLEIAPDD